MVVMLCMKSCLYGVFILHWGGVLVLICVTKVYDHQIFMTSGCQNLAQRKMPILGVPNHRFLRFKFHWENRLRPYIFLISFLLFRFNSEAPSWPKLKLKVVGLKTWLTSGGQYVQSMKMGHLYILNRVFGVSKSLLRSSFAHILKILELGNFRRNSKIIKLFWVQFLRLLF